MKVVLCCDTDWFLSEEALMLYAPCMYHPTYDHFKVQMEDYLNEQSVRIYICENLEKKTGMMVLKYSGVAAELIFKIEIWSYEVVAVLIEENIKAAHSTALESGNCSTRGDEQSA